MSLNLSNQVPKDDHLLDEEFSADFAINKPDDTQLPKTNDELIETVSKNDGFVAASETSYDKVNRSGTFKKKKRLAIDSDSEDEKDEVVIKTNLDTKEKQILVDSDCNPFSFPWGEEWDANYDKEESEKVSRVFHHNWLRITVISK